MLLNRAILYQDSQNNDLLKEAVAPRAEMWTSNAKRPTGDWMTTELLT